MSYCIKNLLFNIGNQPSLTEYVYNIIQNEWEPNWNMQNEEAFRDDLLNILYNRLKKTHVIGKETGRALADIRIDNIGIELKLNLSNKSEKDRLIGQVQGYLDVYDDVLVVLLGKTSPTTVSEIRSRLHNLVQSYIKPDPLLGNFKPVQTKRIYLIVKSPGSGTKPKSKPRTTNNDLLSKARELDRKLFGDWG